MQRIRGLYETPTTVKSVRSNTTGRLSAMRVMGKKSFILAGALGFGGFMFIANSIWDLYRKISVPHGTTSYAFDIMVNLLIWPLVGYFAGLICLMTANRSTNQR